MNSINWNATKCVTAQWLRSNQKSLTTLNNAACVVAGVEGDFTVLEGHHVAEDVRLDLFRALPRLTEVTVQVDPR